MAKRLQSIKLPRDLTLGGTKPKRTFTPNLNVTRNKEKNKNILHKSDDKRKQYNKRDNKNNNKKFERIERFVQSSGIFSDGVSSDIIAKARYGRPYIRDESPCIMSMPKVKKNEWQVDGNNENKVYDNIMGGDDSSDDDEKLPFAPLSWNENDLKESKVPISIKPEVKIEHDDTHKLELNRLKIEENCIPAEFQDSDVISDNNPALTLWSLPDSFSGKGFSDDPNITKVFDYKLSDMVEGQIGTLKVRKSGKIEVYIGHAKYDLEATDLEIFTEKIIEIDVTENSPPVSAVLGEVQNRFMLNPDWEYLLKNS